MYKKFTYLVCALGLSQFAYAANDYENALKAFQQDDIDASYIHLKNALKDNERNLPATILMGQVLLRKGLYQEGIDVFYDALSMNADPNPFIYELARALLFNQKYEDVITLSNRRDLTKENQIKMLLLQSNAYLGLNQSATAIDSLLQAESLAPNRLGTLTSIAAFYVDEREFSKARQYLDRAISLAPNNSRVWQLSGKFYNAQGNGQEALVSFKKAYELDAKDPVIMRSLANQYAMLNELDQALVFVDKILKETPFDTYTELLKSRLLIRNGQQEQAQLILESISTRLSLLTDAQKNSDPSIAFVSGSAAFLQGNYEQAQKDLIYYVNAKPEDLSGITMLVEIYQSQRQHEKVESLLERFEPRIKKDLFLSLNLYNIYLKNNKTYKAKGLLGEIERLYPDNLLIIVAKANYLVETNRIDEAITLLVENRQSTYNITYELNLGNLYLSNGDFVNANKIADSLLAHDDKASQHLIFKGIVLSKQQQWDNSIEYFNTVLESDPKHFAANFNKATALAAKANSTEATSIILPMVEAYPNNLGLKVLLARLYRDTSEPKKAIEILTGILKLKPRQLDASELLFELYYGQGNYELALEEANRLTTNTFLNAKYLSLKAQALTKLGRYTDANVQLGKLLGLAEDAQDFYQLSQLQSAARYFPDALKSLNNAIALAPNSSILLIEKSKLYLTLDRASDSKAILDKLLGENSKSPNVLYAYGLYYLHVQRLEQAYNKFAQALSSDPNFSGAYAQMYGLAKSGIKTNSFIKTGEMFVKESPKNSLARNLLADAYLNKGDNENALKHYLALENEAVINQSVLFNNIAFLYIDSNLDSALVYIEKAYAAEANSPTILDTYGWILALKGDFINALEKLRRAAAIKSNDPQIQYHLGYTLEKLGRLSDAKTELNKAVASSQAFDELDAAKALLATIN